MTGRRRTGALMVALLLGFGAAGCGGEPMPAPSASAGPSAAEAERPTVAGTTVATLSVEGMT